MEGLFRAEIEGTELKVCDGCKGFGKSLGEVKQVEERIKRVMVSGQKPIIEEVEEAVVSDFAEQIRNAREKKDLKQGEFARKLNERESLLQKWEAGSLKPSVKVARKLERLLRLRFVEKVKKGGKVDLKGGRSGEVTLGDLIKVRKRN